MRHKLKYFFQYIEVKKQAGMPSFAFVQFDNIRSTVAAWQAMENETINGQKIKARSNNNHFISF